MEFKDRLRKVDDEPNRISKCNRYFFYFRKQMGKRKNRIPFMVERQIYRKHNVIARYVVMMITAVILFAGLGGSSGFAFPFSQNEIMAVNAAEINGYGFAGGDGESEETAFLIAAPEQLDNIRNYLGDAASDVRYYFKQVADIDLTEFLKDSETGWNPIGTGNSSGECFYGVYDGGLFEIKGLWCNRPQDVYTGLFGHVESSKITRTRLSLLERGIIGGEIAGGIAAQASETIIENCSVKGAIKAEGSFSDDMEEMFAGGIAGQTINNSHIESCYFSGVIIDSYAFTSDVAESADGISIRGLGGITGYMAQSHIANCYANFSVIKDDEHDLCRANGGITGVHGLDSVIENCLAVITAESHVFPLTAGIIEGWLGFGAQPKLRINGSYAYYTDDAYATIDILDVPDPRGLSKDEYTRVLSLQEISKRETYIGANGMPWDFKTVWGFDRDGNILLRVFGGAYNPHPPIDLTWLWITTTCIIVAGAAALVTFIIYRRKKPLIVKETETIVETRHVYIGDERQPLPNDLTPKEREVAALLLEWKSRRDIEEILALSANAVNFHIKNIYEKCECHSHKEFIVKFGTEKNS